MPLRLRPWHLFQFRSSSRISRDYGAPSSEVATSRITDLRDEDIKDPLVEIEVGSEVVESRFKFMKVNTGSMKRVSKEMLRYVESMMEHYHRS